MEGFHGSAVYRANEVEEEIGGYDEDGGGEVEVGVVNDDVLWVVGLVGEHHGVAVLCVEGGY